MDSNSPGGLGTVRWSDSDSSDDEGDGTLQRRLADTASVVSVVARERDVLNEALSQTEQEALSLREILFEREAQVTSSFEHVCSICLNSNTPSIF